MTDSWFAKCSTAATLFLIWVLLSAVVSAQPTADEVLSLPGLKGALSSRQYSGYLSASGSIKLHYWFVESQGDPTTDPVLLWLNGGPSCSSVDGYLTELGPYWVNSNGKTLSINNYSWTKVASIIFLEAPAGVGYSYADSPDYTTNDDKTAENNQLALIDFFTKFPDMLKNDFYITGESYAGMYIPTLALRLMQSKTDINLKGVAIGNGFLDRVLNTETKLEYIYYHGIIGESLWKKLQLNCCSNGSCTYINSPNPLCVQLQVQALNTLNKQGINPYDVTGNCNGDFLNDSLTVLSWMELTSSGVKIAIPPRDNVKDAFLPCIDTRPIKLYMNRYDVKKALHIPSSVTHKWSVCFPALAANYTSQYSTMRPQIKTLLTKYRVLAYNGDADSVCNFLGDQKFVASLNQSELNDRRPWIYENQVAGFVQEYERVTFMTVKNSGHMVPQITPGPALQMISSFLKEKPQ